MCGRYALWDDPADVGIEPDENLAPQWAPSWNVAPGTLIPVIGATAAEDGPDRTRDTSPPRMPGVPNDERIDLPRRSKVWLRALTWGLVPHWTKASTKPRPGPINARVETMLEKPYFKSPALSRRGIVPANGYYEWQATENGKQPYFITDATPNQPNPMYLGALYDAWKAPDGTWLRTVCIITRAARGDMAEIHDRTPFALPADLISDWLNPALNNTASVQELIDQVPYPRLTATPVGSQVGSVRNNGPHLVHPLEDLL